MSEHEQEPTPVSTLDMVKNAQNLQEEQLRSERLADLLFHKHINKVFSADEIERIEQDFLRAKKGLNMGERMHLALNPQFLGIINVVELGLTEDPLKAGQVDGLKSQYHDLLDWMARHGWNPEELPRSPENRQIKVSPSPVSNAYCIVERTRSLLKTTTEVTHPIDGERPVDVSIAKRMVFAIPSGLYEGIRRFCEVTDPSESEDEAAEKVNIKIEEIMDGKSAKYNKSLIHPIRTAYYLMAYPQDLNPQHLE